MSLLLIRGHAFVMALGASAAARRLTPPLLTSSLRTTVLVAVHNSTTHGDDDDVARRRRQLYSPRCLLSSGPLSPKIPQTTREALIAQTKAKVAKVEAKKMLMVNARRDKMRRHKRKREAQECSITEAERDARRARDAQATAWLEEVYALDAGLSSQREVLSPRLRIAIDLVYDSTSSLYSSLGRQLGCAYGLMRKASRVDLIPSVHLTCAKGEVMEALAKNGGNAWRMHRHAASVFDVFPNKERLIYLTPDSPNILEEIDPSKVYVIGGLVDRVVLKNKSYSRAATHGVATARLPLKEFFSKQGTKGQKHMSNMALAVDRVIQILMKKYEVDDWDEALSAVFPGAVAMVGRGVGEEGVNKNDASN
ncbi:hypothetical protein VYU27_005167 [Nannochloropsis oceanica]